jgi:hypothetical protein
MSHAPSLTVNRALWAVRGPFERGAMARTLGPVAPLSNPAGDATTSAVAALFGDLSVAACRIRLRAASERDALRDDRRSRAHSERSAERFGAHRLGNVPGSGHIELADSLPGKSERRRTAGWPERCCESRCSLSIIRKDP